MPSMFIHWHIDSNNLNRPKCQADHPNFVGIEWKIRNYQSFIQQPIITKGKNTLGWSDWQIKCKRLSLLQTLSCYIIYYNSPKGVWTCDIVQQSFSKARLKVFWSPNKLSLFGSLGSLKKKTKYNLGGNILAPTAGRVLDLVLKARKGCKNSRIFGLYTL